MEPMEHLDPATEPSGLKHRLGQIGRTLKKIDLPQRVIDRPFTSIAIAAGAGALVALIRPRQSRAVEEATEAERGPVTAALIGLLGAAGLRVVREVAVFELGRVARNFMRERESAHEAPMGPNPGAGGGVRYTTSP